VQLSIDRFDQAEVLSQFVQQGNSTEGGAIDAVVELEVKVTAAAKDGLGTIGEFGFVEASLDESLPCLEFLTQKAMASARGVFALAAVLLLASVRLLL
jgi:aminoglycoside phosphotransferase family enzyme